MHVSEDAPVDAVDEEPLLLCTVCLKHGDTSPAVQFVGKEPVCEEHLMMFLRELRRRQVAAHRQAKKLARRQRQAERLPSFELMRESRRANNIARAQKRG